MAARSECGRRKLEKRPGPDRERREEERHVDGDEAGLRVAGELSELDVLVVGLHCVNKHGVSNPFQLFQFSIFHKHKTKE